MRKQLLVLIIAFMIPFISYRTSGTWDVSAELIAYLISLSLCFGLFYSYVFTERIILKINPNIRKGTRISLYFFACIIFIVIYSFVYANLYNLIWAAIDQVPLFSTDSYMPNVIATFMYCIKDYTLAAILGSTFYLILIELNNRYTLRKVKKKYSKK